MQPQTPLSKENEPQHVYIKDRFFQTSTYKSRFLQTHIIIVNVNVLTTLKSPNTTIIIIIIMSRKEEKKEKEDGNDGNNLRIIIIFIISIFTNVDNSHNNDDNDDVDHDDNDGHETSNDNDGVQEKEEEEQEEEMEEQVERIYTITLKCWNATEGKKKTLKQIKHTYKQAKQMHRFDLNSYETPNRGMEN